MAKIGLFVTLSAMISALTFATMREGSAEAGGNCVRKDFKTEMVKAACAKGGQTEAKDVMKKFQKDHKIKSCNDCHSKLAPNYELKADGLEQFKKAGGK